MQGDAPFTSHPFHGHAFVASGLLQKVLKLFSKSTALGICERVYGTSSKRKMKGKCWPVKYIIKLTNSVRSANAFHQPKDVCGSSLLAIAPPQIHQPQQPCLRSEARSRCTIGMVSASTQTQDATLPHGLHAAMPRLYPARPAPTTDTCTIVGSVHLSGLNLFVSPSATSRTRWSDVLLHPHATV